MRQVDENEPVTDTTSEPNPLVRLDEIPAARRLADLISIIADLDFTIAATALALRTDSRRGGDDAVTHRSLFDAALIAYGRCFASGRRYRLSDSVLDRDDAREAHDFFIGLRDKHIAHRASDFDRATVGVTLAAKHDPPRRVLGTAEFFVRRVGEDPDTIRALCDLGNYVKSRVVPSVAAMRDSVRESASNIPIEDLYARAGPMGFETPGEGAVRRKPRKPGKTR